MDMIAVIIALFMTLLWYFFDNRTKNKQPFSRPVRQFQAVIRRDAIDAYKRKIAERQLAKVSPQEPLGRLYYSTPGKTYTCFIWKGRVLTSGKTWPYPPNKP